MYYTKAMCEMLKDKGEDVIKLFSYYLDNYFETLEEPEFSDYDLSRMWHYLIICGLWHEIKSKGKYIKVAQKQLAATINANVAYYYYLTSNNRKPKTLTIKQYKHKLDYQREYQRQKAIKKREVEK